MKAAGLTKDDLKLRIGIFGAEPWTQEMRTQIENRLGLKAYDIYGLSEIMGPGVSMNCDCQAGLHIISDHFIAEIIDPDTGKYYLMAQENFFTCITKSLTSYQIQNQRFICINPRSLCGRTSARMEKVTGRSDDMIITVV